MIDKVDASVTSLEAAAQKLDTYSKELGYMHRFSKKLIIHLNSW